MTPTRRGRGASGRSSNVAFFGGALAAGAISLVNARRLGLAPRIQAAIAALGLAGFAGALVAASLAGLSSDRVAGRVIALVACGGMYLLMRSADRVRHFHEQDEETAYDSLWGPGLLAVSTLGIVETVAISLAGDSG